MQQIHHGVVLPLVVAGRCIDGHAALHLQRRTVVPYLTQITVGYLVHAVEIALVTFLIAHNEDIGERDDVTVDIHIGRVFHTRHTIDVKGIAIHLGRKLTGSIAPHSVRSLCQGSHVRLLREEVACYLYLHCLGGEEVKGNRSVGIHYR